MRIGHFILCISVYVFLIASSSFGGQGGSTSKEAKPQAPKCPMSLPMHFDQERVHRKTRTYSFLLLGDGEKDRFTEEITRLFEHDESASMAVVTKEQLLEGNLSDGCFLFYVVDADNFLKRDASLEEADLELLAEIQQRFEKDRHDRGVQIIFTGSPSNQHDQECLVQKFKNLAEPWNISLFSNDFSFFHAGFAKDENLLRDLYVSLKYWY